MPFFLGVALAYALVEDFAPSNVSFLAFALFMGCAMSITAFPVLARILKERDLTHTPAGALAISCAAIDDVTAWCLLATVIAIIKADGPYGAIFTVALSVIFVLMMLLVARPLLRRFVAYCNATQRSENTVSAVIFAAVFLAAFCTDVIGIHPLFGAFLAGVIVPPDAKFRERLATRIEYVCVVLLLPLFFAYTGLKTQIGLLDSAYLWFVCGLIILAAVAGKFAGSVFAARITGQSWQDACTVGALMNTRGLMELIVLNIGYELGILSPVVFSMMVLMAVVTTFMTCPALSLIAFISRRKGDSLAASAALRSP